MTVLYKMVSLVFASRLKSVFDQLIFKEQKGFMSGRFIAENKKKVFTIFYFKWKKIKNYSIKFHKFEKTFNTVSWDFIAEIIKIF